MKKEKTIKKTAGRLLAASVMGTSAFAGNLLVFQKERYAVCIGHVQRWNDK